MEARVESSTTRSRSIAVAFEGVTKRFGDLEVVRSLDLRVRTSERVAIIGPSGSGKTTVLRLLIGLERPDEGEIIVDGEPFWHMQKKGRLAPADEGHLRRIRGKVGLVFQQFNLFPHMTAIRNVTQGPERVLALSRTEAEERALELLDKVGLSDKAQAYPAQLSGGQQQRVAIARALAMQPRVMLFDEVTSALDPELVGEVLSVLRRLAHETDMTMIFVTHEMRFAKEVADRVIMFDEGRVIEDARPDVIFSAPLQDRTRSFLQAILAP